MAGLIGLAPDRVDWVARRVYEAKGGTGAADAVSRQGAFYALMLWAAQGAAWGEIAKHRRLVIAGDMNAHSKTWNPKAAYNRNHVFWERLIQEEDMFVWITDEATRMGPGATNHSIIDLTLSSPNVELNWCLLDEEATGSDHEILS